MHRDGILDTVLRRAGVLGALVDGPLDKRSLVDAVDVSRSTVDRAVRELESLGLVRRDDGRQVATLAGRLVYRSLQQYHTRTEAVLQASDLLVHLDPDCGIDTRLLSGASQCAAEQPAPFLPAERLEQLVVDAGRVHALVRSITDARSLRIVREAVLDGTSYEAIYTADVARHVRESYAEQRRRMVATDNYWAFETERLPFGLLLAYESDPRPGRQGLPRGASVATRDGAASRSAASRSLQPDPGADGDGDGDGAAADATSRSDASGERGSATVDGPPAPAATVGVAVYDEGNDLRGAIFNDSPAAVAWAEETYRARREAATEITQTF
jgi:predicted transcriptional regulator